MSDDLFLANLAMDAYNRGHRARMNSPGAQVGNPFVSASDAANAVRYVTL